MVQTFFEKINDEISVLRFLSRLTSKAGSISSILIIEIEDIDPAYFLAFNKKTSSFLQTLLSTHPSKP
jgi:hypothetical protein